LRFAQELRKDSPTAGANCGKTFVLDERDQLREWSFQGQGPKSS
jgi:hypothetical protein